MSHHLFTKQVWIMLVAAILFTGVFFGGVYFWFNDVQRYILEAENAAEQVEPNGQDGISKKMVEAQDTAMAAFQNGKKQPSPPARSRDVRSAPVRTAAVRKFGFTRPSLIPRR